MISIIFHIDTADSTSPNLLNDCRDIFLRIARHGRQSEKIMQLKGKTAAITGGTAGIGRAIAETFLAEGANVAIMSRSPDKGAKTLEELDAGDRAIFVAGDVMDQASVEGFIDKTVETFGTIDILVNNAGGAGNLAPLAELSDEVFDETMKWNIYSTFW